MKPTKAIEILTARLNCEEEGNPRDVYNATKLGNEALGRLEDWRQGKVLNPDFMLPSETEE